MRYGAVAVAVFAALPVHAGTWLSAPVDGLWNNGANWDTLTVPAGDTTVAQFGPTTSSSVTLTGTPVSVGTIKLNNAPSYTFVVDLFGQLALRDAGIQNVNSAAANFLVDGGTMRFQNNAAAANSVMYVMNGGTLSFENNSSNADGSIYGDSASQVTFSGTSSAGSLLSLVTTSGTVTLQDNATADHSFLQANVGGTVEFKNSATAASSVLNNSGSLNFYDTTTAANASLTTNAGGITIFQGQSTAGSANILTKTAGTLKFLEGSSAGSAALVTETGATTQFNVTAGSSITVGSIAGAGSYTLGTQNNLVVGGLNTDTTVSGSISGSTGSLTKVGSGKLTLSGTNSYLGGTTINAGTLQIGDGGTSGTLLGAVTNNSALAFNRSDNSVFTGAISGTGTLTKLGAGTLTLTGTNTFTGTTTISAGTLQIGNNGTTGSLAGDVINNGTLTFNRTGSLSYGGVISGSGNVIKATTGTVTLTGANTYTGGTRINNGVLAISADNNLGDVSSVLTFGGGTLQLNGGITLARSVSLATVGMVNTNGFNGGISGVISGTGVLVKNGAGTLVLTNNNTYTGATNINAGTLQIGNGGTSGAVVGNITNNSALAFNHSDSHTYGGVISGTGTVTQAGSGVLTLSGTNTYSGGTAINAGTLRVTADSNLGNASGGLSFGGGTLQLGSAMTLNRAVTLNTGGGAIDTNGFNSTLASAVGGSGGLAKTGAGTLTLSGANSYSGGTAINAGTLRISADNNLGAVGGGLSFNGGTLQMTGGMSLARNVALNSGGGSIDTNGFGAEFTGVISGTGTLNKVGGGALTLSGSNTYSGNTTIAAGTLQVGNGGTTGAIGGNVSNNGTLAFNRSGDYNFGGDITGSGSVAQNGSGVLTLTGANNYTGGTMLNGGTLRVLADSNLGAATGGLTFGGGTLEVTGDTTITRTITLATNGTINTSTFNTNVSGIVSGSGSLNKSGTGTLTLSGANTYTGNTSIGAGTLQIGDGHGTGNIIGDVTNNGTLAFNRSDTFDFAGNITGMGSVAQNGSGVLTLTGTNNYTGGTQINAGTLKVLDNSNLGAASGGLTFGGGTLQVTGSTTINRNVTLASTGTINTAGFNTELAGVVSGSGSLVKTGGGTLTLSGVNTYTGSTTISTGTLQIGNGGNSGNIIGGVTDNGTLAFNRSDAFNFGGNIIGTGSVSQVGPGVLTLTGANTYSGGTSINGGTLRVIADSNLGATTGGVSFNGGTLQLASGTTINRNLTLNAAGGSIDTNGSNSSVATAITGNGALTKVGAGTLALTAANNYSGGTTVSGGTLQIGNGTATGSIAGNVTNNGTLAFNRSDNTTFGGVISGTGAVTKMGAGTLALSGVNNYSGATFINAGTLELSGTGRINGTSGVVISQAPGDNGTLRVTGTGALTTAGDITVGGGASGTLTVDGGGTVGAARVILGTSSIAGTLNIGAGAAPGILNVSQIITGANSNSAVVLNHNQSSYTLSSSLRNSLSLYQNGTGTTTLTATTNQYSGNTVLNAGVLRISSNNSIGGAGAIFNGGTLQLAGAVNSFTKPIVVNSGGGTFDIGNFNVSLSGNLGGTGRLIKAGSGELTISGTNTSSGGLTVSAGTVTGNAQNLTGNILNNGTLKFDQMQDTSGTYAGALTGSGNLIKSGLGTVEFSGTSTFSGATSIDDGTFIITGTLGSSTMTVGPAATLMGTGTINGNLNMLGHFTPYAAHPYGTLTVNGNLVFQPGSLFTVEVDDSGHNSSIAVTGTGHTATISGGDVEVVTGGSDFEPSAQYTLISTTGGVSGAFDSVNGDSAFLTPELSYDDKHVYLAFTRNSTSLTSVAKTANEVSTASYLESLSTDSGVHNVVRRILNLNAKDARTAFADLAGDGMVGFGRISQIQNARFMEALSSRLGGGVPGGGSFGIARDLDVQSMPHLDATFFQENSVSRGMWMRSFGGKGAMPSDGNGEGTDWRGSGTAVGFDAPVSSSVVMGASFLYGRNAVELDDRRGGVGRIKSPQAALYGSYASAGDARTGWQFRGVLGYAQPTISSDRVVTLGESSSIASSKHDGRELSVAGEAEVSRNLDAFRVQGMFGLRASRFAEEGYTETGSLADLEIADRTTNSLTASVGARVLLPTYHNQGLFEMRAVFSRELGGLESNLSGRLASSTSDARFTVSGVPMRRDALTLGAGFSGKLKRNLSMYADYGLELRGAGQTQHTGLAGLRLVW